nr:unnamed protein product [Digitaria exilis]
MGSSSSYSRCRRSLRDLVGASDAADDLEEGEYVPGRDESYRFQKVAPPPERSRSRSRTPSSSCESEGTISDDDLSAARFACHACGRGFSSRKAEDGHMRVHGNGRQLVASPAVAGGWAATGRRGWIGGKPSVVAVVSPRNNSESTDHSTAFVEVRPLEPIPVAAIATMTNLLPTSVMPTRTNLSGEESTSSASVEPMRYEPVATLTGRPNPSITDAVVHQLPADQQADPVIYQPPAVSSPAPQQAQSIQQQPLAPPPAHHQPRREYSCKLCGKSYTTHQGLGGHAAGHRNRQKEAEAAAAAAGMMMMGVPAADAGEFLAALCRRGGRKKAEATHECQKCHKVFATGVALGGHMRMHYTGPPIVHKKSKKRCLAAAVSDGADDLRLALSTTIKEEAPSVASAGRQAPAPLEVQGSGTAEGSSSVGEQQQ